MAAGDLLIADRQLELRSYLMGAGCTWENDEGGWSMGRGDVRDHDSANDMAPGDSAGSDYDGPRLFTAPLTTAAANLTEGQALDAADALEELWSASATADLQVHWQRAGASGSRHFYLVGRPRGAVVDRSLAFHGIVTALVMFKAHDPTIHEVLP
jgi:hypothetical protein